MANLTIPAGGHFYDHPSKDFIDLFENIEHLCIRSIKLSGNSYSLETCIWLSRHLLKKCKNLHIVDFSDMFENRPTDEINKCVYVLLNAVKEYKILDFNISQNDLQLSPTMLKNFIICQKNSLKVLNLKQC